METIEFDGNKSLFNNQLSTGIAFSSDLAPQDLLLIKDNIPIQNLSLPLVFGKGNVTAKGEKKSFQFNDNKSVEINGNAEALLRVGVFKDVEKLLSDLKTHDELNIELCGEQDDDTVFVLFSLGYSVDVSVSGSWIFQGGNLSAGLDGARKRRMAVVKAMKADTGLKDAIQATISELRLPSQIKKGKSISPGTLLIIETSGSISGEFKAMAGHQFNWLYETNLNELEGSIGLEAKLGAQLSVGFNFAGEYALALCAHKEDDVRLKLFKQRKKGWNFALGIDAAVKGSLDDNFKNAKIDDLIKATLGTHHDQVFKVLRKIEDISNLDQEKLKEHLNGLTDDVLRKLADVTNVDEKLDNVKEKLLGFLNKWDKLDEKASATLWKLLDDKANDIADIDLDKLKTSFDLFSNPNEKEKVEGELKKVLEDVGYFEKPMGQLLNSILPAEDILSVFVEHDVFESFQTKAAHLRDLLNVKEHLTKFQKTISDELNLDKIKKAAEGDSVEQLGDWLKGMLSDVIEGQDVQEVLEKLKAASEFIDKIKANAKDIFEKTKKALDHEYGFSFAYAYQKENETSALIDATFSLNKSGVATIYKEVLEGDFNNLLIKNTTGITLHLGTLTHRVKREQSVMISLPFMKRDFKRINEAIARGNFIQEDNGRLIMYELEAEDVIKRSKRMSLVSLEGYFKNLVGNDGMADVKDSSLSISYGFKLAVEKLRFIQLEQIVEPFVAQYLMNAFESNENNAELSIDTWMEEMANRVDLIDHNGREIFGNTMINLEIRVPSSIGNAWFELPQNGSDKVYEKISIAVQKRLRSIVPLFFFVSEEVFFNNKENELFAVLMYRSLPPVTNSNFNWHWNFRADLDDMIASGLTMAKIGFYIGKVKEQIKRDLNDEERRKAKWFFHQDNEALLEKMIKESLTPSRPVYEYLMDFFKIEKMIITKTIKVGNRIARFVNSSDKNPNDALNAMEEFGSLITEMFNSAALKILSDKKDYNRYLGADLFITIAELLDPNIKNNSQGILELLVLKDDSNFKIKNYLKGEYPPNTDLIIKQKILDLD